MGLAAFFFVVIHFSFVIVYAWPEPLKPKVLHHFTKAYVEPVFTQRWSMFAPCPTINSRVEINYFFSASDSTGWIRPTSEAIEVHDYFPALHYGELVLAESNLDYWLGLDIDYMDLSVNDPFPVDQKEAFYKGYSYYKIRNFAEGWAHYLYERRVIAAKVRFIREDVTTGEVEVFVLPQYDLSNAG